ncbi:UNVERIFIED_ASMBLY: putative DNA N-6-adenine-methyltransferase [Shigella phage 2019SD1]|uniref:DNA N-6-adenine-methyltransferase n=1 Tax=Shigella phage 2019SD1 TaxID=2848074 RepID=A0A6M5C9T6_9CAUD|nr:DNA methyltransferase [Shigella phage 2019SD1]
MAQSFAPVLTKVLFHHVFYSDHELLISVCYGSESAKLTHAAQEGFSKETEVTFEQIERETFIGNALATGGHYRAVKPNQYYKVTGNRYNGSNTPDIVRDLWSTPSEVVEWMESEYGDYDIDAAASKENAVCEKFYSKETNCLKRWWGSNKHIWLNPPYSNITPFVKKAIEQMEHNNQIDILLPCDTSTGWFYEAQQKAAEIIWITGEVYRRTEQNIPAQDALLSLQRLQVNQCRKQQRKRYFHHARTERR